MDRVDASAILVDDREGSKELIPLIPGCYPTRLDFGDVCFPGNGPSGDILVGVEVKKLGDLISSQSTGRLPGTQIRGLLAADSPLSYVYLLVVGEHRLRADGGLDIRHKSGWHVHRVGNRSVPYSFLEALLIEIQVVGVMMRQVADNYEAAKWLMALAHWWSKPWDKHRAMHKFDRSGDRGLVPGIDDPDYVRKVKVARVVKEFPNMGWERAWAAAEVFPTVRAAVNATEAEWRLVPGVGAVIAKDIVRYIHEQ